MVIFWVKTNKTKKTPSQHSLTTITRENYTSRTYFSHIIIIIAIHSHIISIIHIIFLIFIIIFIPLLIIIIIFFPIITSIPFVLRFCLYLTSSLHHQGPASHCGWSRPSLPNLLTSSISPLGSSHLPLSLLSLTTLSLPSLPSPCCHPARAGRHGRSEVILLTLANTDPQAIFWPSCTSRSTSGSGLSGCASPSGPYHFGGLRCLAVPRFGIFHGRYGSLLHL